MGVRVNYGGLVVAGVGFFLTRYTVSLAIYESPIRFYLAGVVPLALGLGLAAFGVALTVADLEATTVRTTALWCVVGATTMLMLVVLTVLGSSPEGGADFGSVRSQAYLSNFLIGGSVGGTLTGLYAARNGRQRGELRQQTNRLETLNRLLRHEVLNAVTVIRGYATLVDDRADATDVIEGRAAAIEATIEDVKHLTRRTAGGRTTVTTGLDVRLAASVDAVTDSHPEASVSLTGVEEGLRIHADERLEAVFTNLLENAVVHGEDASPTVETSTGPRTVRVSVCDDGPGLPESQRRLLEAGHIEEFDDPRAGFGLNLVRLFVESYGGKIETSVNGGTTVTVVLPRVVREDAPFGRRSGDVRPAAPRLLVTVGASLLAGVCYGVVAEAFGGSIAGIGVFYGIQNSTVGWLTHEFHSVVFGFVFVSLLSLAPERYRGRPATYVAVGLGWGATLWVVAAGVVAPVWLRLLGIPAPLPNLTLPLLVNHLVWGLALGVFTAVGYQYVAPLLSRVDRAGRHGS